MEFPRLLLGRGKTNEIPDIGHFLHEFTDLKVLRIRSPHCPEAINRT